MPCGSHASVRASTTSKALTSTIVTLALLYGYPAFLLLSLWEYGVWDRYVSYVGLPARVVFGPLVSYADFAQVWREATTGDILAVSWLPSIVIGLFLMGIYGSVAAFLTYRSVGRFDGWLDRPRMRDSAPIPEKEPRESEVAEPALQS